MKVTAFLTIATASSLPAPSAAMAAVPKASVAATVEIRRFVNRMFTFISGSIGWANGRMTTRRDCHKRANHPLNYGFRRQAALDVAARRMARRPRPLKIEAAKVTGDIDHLADEIKPGHGAGLEGFRGKA